MKLKEFQLPEECICSLIETKDATWYIEADQLPALYGLKPGANTVKTTSTIDHPEFTKLRNELGDLGYITIQRSWWNGDKVVKPFKLNGMIFRKGETFPCAAALATHIKVLKMNLEF